MRLAVFAFSVSLTLVGAAPALNPRVTKSATVHGVVPSDCDQALTTAPAPRVDVAGIPRAELVALDLTPPPSGDLRTTLRDAQEALRRNDRPRFDANLARARTLLASYPAGAERRAGEELLRIYEDAAHTWDAQFESPFFESASPLYARLSAYPGWSDAVRRGVLKDDRDRTFYPAAESRTFLTSVAADRLGRLGIRATPLPSTRIASSTPTRSRSTLRPRTETPQVPTSRTGTSSPTIRKPATSTKSKPSTRTATRRKSAPVSPDPTARRAPRVTATPAPAAPPPQKQAAAPPAAGGSSSSPVTTTTAGTSSSTPVVPVTSIATTSTATATTGSVTTDTIATGSAFATDTRATETLATGTAATTESTETTATETTATETTATETATETAAPAAEPKRSILLPTILILIGLGVLIVLFRASK